MNRALCVLSLFVAVAATVGWVALGANRGWTRTTQPVKIVDEVTGIEGIQYEKKFVPGLELLGGALLVATLMAGSSFFFRDRQVNTQQTK